MSDNIYEDFIRRVTSDDDMMWSCFRTCQNSTYSAINTKHALVVVFRVVHPEQYGVNLHKTGITEFRPFRTEFDITKHPHWFEIEVIDHAFRWGRKKIFSMEAGKRNSYYQFCREIFLRLRTKAHIVSKERPFDSRLAGVRSALEDILEEK